ncbi:MAG: hypothetical protein ABIR15_22200 [Chitinophagaceae bacterium]
MLKNSFIISLAMLFQIAAFGQGRKVIVQPNRPIPVRPGQPVPSPGNQQGKWFYIATTEVRLSGERDVVNVNNRDLYRAIKFNVTRNALEVFDLSVVFDNGQSQKFSVRNIFQPGTGSRVLDLPGNKRRIRSLIFTYRTRGHLFSQRAHVMIYGLK